MSVKSLVSAFTLGVVLAAPAHAVLQNPAIATIDWQTFQVMAIDTDPLDDVLPAISFILSDSDTRNTQAWAQEFSYTFDGRGNWTESFTVQDGVANASASQDLLQAWFTGPPSTLNAYAQSDRAGRFVVSAKTLVTFQVAASVSIDLPVPLNGQAYAWSRLETDGPGFFGDTENQQRSGTDRLVFAQGQGSLLESSGILYASFYNGTDADMEGNLRAFTTVNSYGFIPVVPEPETYGMMIAGLGLLAAVARRRRAT